MAAAYAELRRRGPPVQRVSTPSAKHSATGDRWAVGVATEELGAPNLIIMADAPTDELATLCHHRRPPN